MATLQVKRASNTTVPAALAHGELGVCDNKLYFGNSSRTPIRLALASELGNYLPLSGGTMTGTLNAINLNAIAVQLKNSDVVKATMQYNATTDCIEFVFA